VDSAPGDATSGLTESRVTTSGFDLSGLDLWFGGALYNNISMLVLPSSDATGAFHFESAWLRFDDLFGSRWLNLKFGKYELDTLLSERRFLTLSNVGGLYYNYHFAPVADINSFSGTGQGDNQLGVELMGHSRNSYTRYAVSLLSSNNGEVGLPTNRTYDLYANFNQGFEIPGLGLQRIGVFGYEGRAPTYFLTNNGAPILGTGRGNKSFYRAGAYGLWYAGKFDFSTYYMHGVDSPFLGTGTPATQALPDGARAPTWNGGFGEVHYNLNPQLVLIGRYELVRMDRQALPTTIGNLGDLDAWTVGYRWYPMMFSRAGLAFDMEYSRSRQVGTSLVTGRDFQQSSLFAGWDFAF
jgi:hypothetical protein